MSQTFLNGAVTLHQGDCLEILATLPENSVESIVCDPPYHLASIVKRFGSQNAAPAQEGKTGAFVRASKGFMGQQWDGGDIAFRVETWAACLRVLKPGGYLIAFSSSRTFGRMSVAIEDAGFETHPMIGWIFGSGFPKAHKVKDPEFDGWAYSKQALKPALEPIYMGQKPFSEANGTLNMQHWGVGALNIDACRIHVHMKPGRWPANLAHDGSPEVVAAFPEAPGQQRAVGPELGPMSSVNTYGDYGPRGNHDPRSDSGSAARFFYSAKADAEDRSGSRHPTVKPLDLMQWLIRMVTPKGAVVLDPFAGSGTTGEAAWREGMRAILIERESEYCADIARRMDLADKPSKRTAVVKTVKAGSRRADLPLFSEE